MLLIGEREVGCDTDELGFPSVDTCLAVVVQLENHLVGWHKLNTDSATTKDDCVRLNAFIAANPGGNAVHLYAATNRKNHGQDWRAELLGIAEALKYHGPATSIDLHVNTEGVYVQFDRDGPGRCCVVRYKRNAKMDYAKEKRDIITTPHRRLLTKQGETFDVLYSTTGKASVNSSAVINNKSSKGRLNTVSSGRQNTVTAP